MGAKRGKGIGAVICPNEGPSVSRVRGGGTHLIKEASEQERAPLPPPKDTWLCRGEEKGCLACFGFCHFSLLLGV